MSALPKYSHVYPINKKTLGKIYEGEYPVSYEGEFKVTLGPKTYDTFKVIYSGKGKKRDEIFVEEYITRRYHWLVD